MKTAKSRYVERYKDIYRNGYWQWVVVKVLQEKVGKEWKDVPVQEEK